MAQSKKGSPAPTKLTPIHPGEALADVLHAAKVTANAAALAMGLAPCALTRIINGQWNITAPIALRIAQYFGTSVEMWMNLQTNYDVKVAGDKEESRIARKVRPLERSIA
jgi:antitoxin HigA-1